MASFWLTFPSSGQACVNAEGVEAAKAKGLELTGEEPTDCKGIPYPATPELNPGECPPFCYTPRQCAGRSACPKDYACSN